MASVAFTREAIQICTEAQLFAISEMSTNSSFILIDVHAAGPFDLPSGYLTFRADYKDATGSIYGGVSPEGDIST